MTKHSESHDGNVSSTRVRVLVVGDTGQNGFDPIPIDISPYREYRSSFDTIFRPHPCSHTSYY